MASEYLKPMLDVGSPRVLNTNVITKQILAQDPSARPFFRCRPLNNMVLIKDNDPMSRTSSIGTKLYLPFNENDIYEGGRTIFLHDKNTAQALIDVFGNGALPRELLDEDMKMMRILDRLPSLDPFLLKDVFLNEKIDVNPAYFEVGKELWNQIELYILQNFEPLARAAFPNAMESDEVARKLIEKIWEGRDLEALKPLIIAFRLPAGQEMEIFSAWKGVIFYGFEYERSKPMMGEIITYLRELKVPTGALTGGEKEDFIKAQEKARERLQDEWNAVTRVLSDYQAAYDKMFKAKTGSSDFVSFLQNSSKAYQTLGNGLGKIGHALYCYDAIAKRFPGRKLSWDQSREFVALLGKIFNADRKP